MKTKHPKKQTSDTLNLTAAEAADLARREKIIETECAGSDERKGTELLGITRPPRRYHRKLGFKKIEEYALKRFGTKIGTSHSHVQRLLRLGRLAEQIRKYPNGNLIPLDRESIARPLADRINQPHLGKCIEQVILMIETRNAEAKKTGIEPRPITASKVQRAVNDAEKEHRIDQHKLRPTTKKELAEGFHVSKVEDGLPFINDGEVDFTFTSFPYNCGLPYYSHGKQVWDDKIPLDQLLDYYAKWIKVIERITNPEYGRFAVNIADVYNAPWMKAGEDVVYLDMEVDRIIRASTDFKRYAKLIWDKGDNQRMSPKHGSVASYSKPTIERQAEIILVYYRGCSHRPNDPKRKDMDNTEYVRTLQKNLWAQNAFCGKASHDKHPCPYPVKLCENALKLFTAPPGPNGEIDTVCDPFGGTGSLAEAAFNLGRKSIYNDASQEYAEGAMERIAKLMKENQSNSRKR